jgi:hypothetical protein
VRARVSLTPPIRRRSKAWARPDWSAWVRSYRIFAARRLRDRAAAGSAATLQAMLQALLDLDD